MQMQLQKIAAGLLAAALEGEFGDIVITQL
jgi:hypothetical protein